MKNSESTETYLKEIYRISKTHEHVRSIDIANKLNVTKASINGAVKKLVKEGYLNHQPYGLIFLTDKGIEKAQGLCSKQEIITKYLMETLYLDKINAFEEACKIEHVISQDMVEKMKEIYGL